MAMLAIFAVLGGDFSRRGYAQRIAIASGVALVVRLLAFSATSAAAKDPELNIVQYALPVVVVLIVSYLFFLRPILKRRLVHARVTRSPLMGPA